MGNPIFNRTELLVGSDAMQRIAEARVILFGVGGVGSWCAESLVRSGIQHLTIVDSDRVCVTNINRQLMATSHTVGEVKVEALRERLLQINPRADVCALQEIYSRDTHDSFLLEQYDYIVDAIDSLSNKLELIVRATDKSLARDGRYPIFFSSMGAALKMDPTQIRVSEFWEVDGCPLAATLRKRMRKQLRFPERKFKCVWSPERNETAEPKGTMMPVTATFGLTLASLVLKDIQLHCSNMSGAALRRRSMVPWPTSPPSWASPSRASSSST